MIALGLSNILGSFVGSMPVTASFRQDNIVAATSLKVVFAF
jgi:MFS superfamily sulfate permease-like transporter